MPRHFFVSTDMVNDSRIFFTGSDVRYIRDSLRMKPGMELSAVDGHSMQYNAVIEKMENDKITARIISRKEFNHKTTHPIILSQAVPKAQKMDFVVEKATELGVESIIPMVTERTIIRKKYNTERWSRLAKMASQQSGRLNVPEISNVCDFSKAVSLVKPDDLALIPWEAETEVDILDAIKKKQKFNRIWVFIGPEGGFSVAEIQRAVEAGIMPLTLGNQILRTETAGLVALSIIQFFNGREK